MKLKFLFRRVFRYYRNHGINSTFSRALLACKRSLFQKRTIIYYADLSEAAHEDEFRFDGLKVYRFIDRTGIGNSDMDTFRRYFDTQRFEAVIESRFEKGAELWMLKEKQKLVGFNWTIKNRTVDQFFFPLPSRCVFIFDQEIFPDYRGRGLNALLTRYILAELQSEGFTHAFISIKEWNKSNIRAISKTIFRKIGVAWRFRFFSKDFVIWSDMKATDNAGHI